MNDRVVKRRSVVFRAGALAVVLATAGATSACWFDKSDYKGGGRLDHWHDTDEAEEGGTSQSAPAGSGTGTGTTPPPPPPDDSDSGIDEG